MDPNEGNRGDTWHEEPTVDFRELCQAIEVLSASPKRAWRGQANSEWMLESTLDRRLQQVAPQESYEQWLDRELQMIARFRSLAKPYASDIEKQHLHGDNWTALAFGRHAGLPTRLVDWTKSPWVAAWFACHEHSDADGVIWWFGQESLENVLHPRWCGWGVPKIPTSPTGERDLAATAFKPHGRAWVSEIHYSSPCPRMEAQQGFITTCGRLRKTHNDAIDELPESETISRGRIRIPAALKGEVLASLREMNIHAKSLEYPGVDIVARSIEP